MDAERINTTSGQEPVIDILKTNLLYQIRFGLEIDVPKYEQDFFRYMKIINGRDMSGDKISACWDLLKSSRAIILGLVAKKGKFNEIFRLVQLYNAWSYYVSETLPEKGTYATDITKTTKSELKDLTQLLESRYLFTPNPTYQMRETTRYGNLSKKLQIQDPQTRANIERLEQTAFAND
jgi:hypothetical protein